MRLLLPLVALATPLAAAAHPLGNFTINHYAAVHVGQRVLTVRYVVDMAEIPAYQTIGEIDRNGNGTIDPDEREAYLSRAPADLARHLTLIVDGREVPLTAGQGTLSLPPGAGGLPTLRLEVTFEASLPGARGEVEFRDGNFPGRLGWQEVIADSGDGIALLDSTVPRTDRSRALRDYPTDLLARPPHVTEARFRMASATAGDGGTGAATVHDTSTAPGGFRDRLTELIATRAPLGPGLVVTSLLVAAALGALHALSPGHGKTIVGAYLIGARGTARHAFFLGMIVTATHTIGVYALGLVTLTASHYIVPERLFPWLGAASGLLVLGIGASLATTRLEAARNGHLRGRGHDHEHDHRHGHHHHHHHDDGHDHGHSHVHDASEGALTWRCLFALGVSGGLLPCPSALVVMLGAIALGRIAFGLLLIVAFSVGLAAVLIAIGLLFVYARRWFNRLPADGRVAQYVPVASALVISVAGLFIVVQALAQMGVLRAWT